MKKWLRGLRNRHRDFDPIFIAGAMGSGTSLVAVAIAERFDAGGLAYESALHVAADSPLRIQAVKDFESIRAYEDSILPRADWNVEAARESLLRLYRRTATGDSRRVIDKGPNTNQVRAEFLAQCFPTAHFVAIFRDPVVNIEGFRRKWGTFGDDTLEENIRFWAELHRRLLDTGSALGDRLNIVEYETLVNAPDAMLETLGQRLGLARGHSAIDLRDRPNEPGKGLRSFVGGHVSVESGANAEAYERIGSDFAEQIRSALDPIHQTLQERALRPPA
ncbi:MAG: sulfotransferase [Myxococcota bacterium]